MRESIPHTNADAAGLAEAFQHDFPNATLPGGGGKAEAEPKPAPGQPEDHFKAGVLLAPNGVPHFPS